MISVGEAHDVQKIVNLPDVLSGGPWPETSESTCFAIADCLWLARDRISNSISRLDEEIASLLRPTPNESGAFPCQTDGLAFQTFLVRLGDIHRLLTGHRDTCDRLGRFCNDTGIGAQRAKLLINLSLSLALFILTLRVALAVFAPGSVSLVFAAVPANTHRFCRGIIAQFADEIGTLGLRHFGQQTAISALVSAAMDGAIQAHQERRETWDLSGMLDTAISGGLGGFFGAFPSPLQGALSRIGWNGLTSGTAEMLSSLVHGDTNLGSAFAGGVFSGFISSSRAPTAPGSQLPGQSTKSHELTAGYSESAAERPDFATRHDKARKVAGPTFRDTVSPPTAHPRTADPVEEIAQSAAGTRSGNGQVNQRTIVDFWRAVPHEPRLDGIVDNNNVLTLSDSVDGASDRRQALVEFAATSVHLSPQHVRLEPIGCAETSSRGVPVFFIRHPQGEAPLGIVKVVSHFDELAREMSAQHRLGNPEFSLFRVPEILAVVRATGDNGKDVGIIAMTSAEGQSFPRLLKSIGEAPAFPRPQEFVDKKQTFPDLTRPRAFGSLRRTFGLTGAALAELNTRPRGSGQPVSPSYGTWYFNEADHFVQQLLADPWVPGLDVHVLRQRIHHSIEYLKRNPGEFASVLFTDANMANLFDHPEKGLTLIDLEKTHYSLNASGGPIGPPAHQMAVFWGSLQDYGWESTLKPIEGTALWRHFLYCYHQNGGPIIPRRAFDFYASHGTLWLLNRLYQNKGALPAEYVNARAAMLTDLLRQRNHQ